ncbi:uncharacterized protein PAC_07871 [Phialocephala subalpina]|uniref:Uncharacterized protein n=1 Tax=Phialocephala subalpina TaxID=576137 RepID=A0A1L7WYZ1_9HELO|nr:uncharacterized protein PAC_07871 [Phialocephala subalpina]
MSPILNAVFELRARANHSNFATSTNELRQQWTEPTDVFSVLLLLGGDIVNKALAQLSGTVLTPVTFSFGWVSYAVTTFLASVGEVKLMPSATESPCLVITAKNGYFRSNSSWVISRVLSDYESWMDPAVRTRLEKMLDERQHYMRLKTRKGTKVPRPRQTGLCISIYEPSKAQTAGEPAHDLVYWTGLGVAVLQLVTAAIPIEACLNGETRNGLAARSSQNTYVLTRGIGAQHAIVILGNGRGLNLEDLAVAGQIRYACSDAVTRTCLAGISALWVSLLVTAAGVKTNTWFLLAVGGIGIVQNVLVAGCRRDPSALGVHLEFREVIGEMTAMDALIALEDKYTKVGRSLLPIFFPGKLLPEEVARWDALKAKAIQEAEAARLDMQGRPIAEPPESWTVHAKTFEKT